MKKLICILISVMTLYYCSPQPTEVEKRIEDGVEVIINHIRPYKIEGEPSFLQLEELFTIDTEKDEVAELGITDIMGFDVDSDGNIYIFLTSKFSQASVNEKLIYKFDRDGMFLISFAQRGQGPGEIQNPSYMRITENEEIPVVDSSSLKLMYFNKDGLLLKETKLPYRIAQNGYVYPLENGYYLAEHNEGELRPVGEGFPKEGAQRALSLYDSDFNFIKYISLVHYSYQLLEMRSPHMHPVRSWEVVDEKIFFGTSRKGYEIQVFDFNGNLLRRIKKEYKPISFQRNREEEWEVKNKVVPDFYPPFQKPFFFDDDGRLFVMTFEIGLNPKEYMFDIFNSDGVFVGRISLNAYARRATNIFPLYATAKNKRLYLLREKESGYKELAVYKMIWE